MIDESLSVDLDKLGILTGKGGWVPIRCMGNDSEGKLRWQVCGKIGPYDRKRWVASMLATGFGELRDNYPKTITIRSGWGTIQDIPNEMMDQAFSFMATNLWRACEIVNAPQ